MDHWRSRRCLISDSPPDLAVSARPSRAQSTVSQETVPMRLPQRSPQRAKPRSCIGSLSAAVSALDTDAAPDTASAAASSACYGDRWGRPHRRLAPTITITEHPMACIHRDRRSPATSHRHSASTHPLGILHSRGSADRAAQRRPTPPDLSPHRDRVARLPAPTITISAIARNPALAGPVLW